METLNVIPLVCSNTSEAELRELSNRFHPGFSFSLHVYCEAEYPLKLLGSHLLFLPQKKPRFAETSQ